jgi:hypothetical protein
MGEPDKRTFWAYFFQALAGAEAGLNPNTSIRHAEPCAAYTVNANSLDTYLKMAKEIYSVVVQAWDNCGSVYKTLLAVTVE